MISYLFSSLIIAAYFTVDRKKVKGNAHDSFALHSFAVLKKKCNACMVTGLSRKVLFTL